MVDNRSCWPVCGAAICFATLVTATMANAAAAQPPSRTAGGQPAQPLPTGQDNSLQAPAKVEVEPIAHDDEIAERLEKILKATGWFENPTVEVDEGVVFLRGRTDDENYKTWAGDLGRNTRDVVAVVNQLEVTQSSPWNFQPGLTGLRDLWHALVYWFPYFLLALVILLVTYGTARWITRGSRSFLASRIQVSLLREVFARSAGILIFLLGLYIVLRISGLTRLALTMIGGTGLLGLVIGIAFRDIAENFLASILLSVQSPFRTGDLVDLAGVLGFVQQLNVRTTVLMSLTGHHVELPNALVYKSIIRNYSSNPHRREDFTVGIGYYVSIPRAQEIALKVLEKHPAVLKTPDPWVLVDNLGSATVSLRVYFWLDGSRHSWLKVRSSVIRLTKRAFQDSDITMPDEVREVIFPQGVPVQMIQEPNSLPSQDRGDSPPKSAGHSSEEIAVEAEGGLDAEDQQIEQQASQARSADEGENLLPSNT